MKIFMLFTAHCLGHVEKFDTDEIDLLQLHHNVKVAEVGESYTAEAWAEYEAGGPHPSVAHLALVEQPPDPQDQKRRELRKELVDALQNKYGDGWKREYVTAMKAVHENDDPDASFLCSEELDTDDDGQISAEEFENNFDAYLDCIVDSEMGDTSPHEESLLEEEEERDELLDKFMNMSDDDFEVLLVEMSEELADTSEPVQQVARKSKNWRQKAWAAKQTAKLQDTTCGRHNFPIHSTGPKWPWEGCDWGLNNVGVWCQGCKGEEELIGACWEKCGAHKNLPHLSTHCSLGVVAYCTETSSDCVDRVVSITTSWLAVAASLNPGTKALAKAAKAAKTAKKVGGSTAAAKAFLKVAMRATYKKLKTKAKKNLRRYIKKNGKELKEEVIDDILDGGLDSMSAYALRGNSDVGDLAEEIVAAVDPTGIYDAVKSLDGGKRCRDLMLSGMPTTGLVESVGCTPVAFQDGRCGPNYGGRCNKNARSWAVYCNEGNGWCGNTAAHRDAQATTTYDWEPIPLSNRPGRCGPSYGGRCNKNTRSYAVYCNIDNGWCGTTAAHRDAQAGSEYDWEPQKEC